MKTDWSDVGTSSSCGCMDIYYCCNSISITLLVIIDLDGSD